MSPNAGFPISSVAMSDDGRYLVFDTDEPVVDELPDDFEADDNGLLDVYMIDRVRRRQRCL